MIKASINLSKLDKTKFIKGEKGTYADLILIETKGNQYGNDYMVKQDQSKEDRDAGIKTEIVGNAKIVGKKSQPEDDEIPF